MNSAQLMEKVAEVAPAKYSFLVETAQEVKESPFREEILGEMDGILKTAAAGFDEMRHVLGKGALSLGKGIAVTALGGIGMALASDMYDATRRGIFKTRNYKKMMAANPDLADKPAEAVQSIFSTLHRFNPEFASDPLVAGSFVRQHAALEVGVGLDAMKHLVDARKGLSESRRLQAPKFTELGDAQMDMLKKQELQTSIEKMRSDMETSRRSSGGGVRPKPLP
jgi:hypothetical protein